MLLFTIILICLNFQMICFPIIALKQIQTELKQSNWNKRKGGMYALQEHYCLSYHLFVCMIVIGWLLNMFSWVTNHSSSINIVQTSHFSLIGSINGIILVLTNQLLVLLGFWAFKEVELLPTFYTISKVCHKLTMAAQ